VVIGEGWVHTVPVGLAQGTLGVRLPNGVGVLRDGLLGLGLLTDTGHLGGLGFPRVHATVGTPRQSTIAARGTLPSHTLTGLLLLGPKLGDFLTKLGNFGEEGLHFSWVRFWGRRGYLGFHWERVTLNNACTIWDLPKRLPIGIP
jgi:hypothetical protein